VVLGPLVFFGLLEGGLRLGGYGFQPELFVGPDAGGNYVVNRKFGWRFFPRPLARPAQPCLLTPKKFGTVRIFVLGESAAMGVPDPAFGFGRILEVMLRRQYPGTRFEVINAAITAINSHVILEIARDCAAHEPDIFVVYMGNNEIVGPYGPGTVFQQWARRRSLVRAAIWTKATRTGQLCDNLLGSLRGGDTLTEWQGMEMFEGRHVAADDPRLATVYESFRRNVADLCAVAKRAKAGMVLSTVAVNLRD
jgi:hypothetical protein